jgi:aminoglycoside 2'-N-acetyltransferase I
MPPPRRTSARPPAHRMPDVRLLATAEVDPGVLTRIRHLLDQAFDGDFSDEDWEHTLGGWHVIVADSAAVLSHAAVVPRILEVADRPLRTGYVEGVATAPGRQGAGLGSLAMTGASGLVRRDFELGALGTGRHRFYERLGWERWRGPTFARHGSEKIRTEEDDDGVMVLRFGPSRNVDLTDPISCEARRGDHW